MTPCSLPYQLCLCCGRVQNIYASCVLLSSVLQVVDRSRDVFVRFDKASFVMKGVAAGYTELICNVLSAEAAVSPAASMVPRGLLGWQWSQFHHVLLPCRNTVSVLWITCASLVAVETVLQVTNLKQPGADLDAAALREHKMPFPAQPQLPCIAPISCWVITPAKVLIPLAYVVLWQLGVMSTMPSRSLPKRLVRRTRRCWWRARPSASASRTWSSPNLQ